MYGRVRLVDDKSYFYSFKDQIHDVFKSLPRQVQVILLSATMPEDVMEVSKQFMREPVSILVKKDEVICRVSRLRLAIERGANVSIRCFS